MHHTEVDVALLIPTQKLLHPVGLALHEQQFKRGVVYPIVIAKKGLFYHIIDGHYRAYLANKKHIASIPPFVIEGDLGIVQSSEKLGLKSLDDMVLLPED